MSTFKEKVLKVVAKIKKGQVLTYGEVARLAGNPKAVRAVGQIMAANENPKVPCHRVIGVGNKMVGYSRKGSVKLKLEILKKEGAFK